MFRKLISDGPLVVDGVFHQGGTPFTAEIGIADDLIRRGVARHADPPAILHEKAAPEQNADALRTEGVTCICLTRNRRDWLPGAIRCYQQQSFANRELLIVADGEPVDDLIPDDPSIRLIHLAEQRTIGEKRNYAVAQARGQWIAHWDDDDRSTPDRLLEQLHLIRSTRKAVTGFRQIDFVDPGGQWFRYTGDPDYAPGSSLLYAREWAVAHPFPSIQIGEDGEFVRTARQHGQIASVMANGRLTATIHSGNTSPRNTGNEMWRQIGRTAAGLTVIIPSRTDSNFRHCVTAVKELEPQAQIVLVDDGITLEPDGWNVVPGQKPFVFGRNINAGILAADRNDVVLLNDDAILRTPGGFRTLQESAVAHPEFGIIAATTNAVGNQAQLPRAVGLREDFRMVCFVCVFIPRTTLDAVGWLDERFTAYGFEDDDYCYRIRRAGLKIGIHDGCFVDHASLKSTFRGDALAGAQLDGGRAIFIDKWGSYPL